MEAIIAADPEYIFITTQGNDTEAAMKLVEELMENNPAWSSLTAVKNGTYYEIPNLPYDWMSSPPSVNRVLGIYWLGNLLYPELYDYDMVAEAQAFYRLFWHYELSEAEAAQLLARSTLKP